MVIEEVARKRRRKRNIQQAVLATLGVAGVLAVTVVAPQALQALPALIGKERYKTLFRAKNSLQRLAAKGHIRFVEKRGVRCAEITEAGRRSLSIQLSRNQKTTKKRRWDGQYRLVIFDIPEYRKAVRDQLRRLVKDAGFLRLQNSVWISPYDNEELISLIKADLRLGKAVLYAVVDQIENDKWIKEHFGLK